MSSRPGPEAGKPRWRQWARSEWGRVDTALLSPQVVDHLATSAVLDEAATLMLYFPMPAEVDLIGLIDKLPASVSVTATRTPPLGPLSLHRVDGADLEEHSYGFLQPTAAAPPVDPSVIDVALVPGLCFAADGIRLGQGAGYFDEFLARCRPDVARVGVSVDQLLVGRLPREPHDLAMSHLATETGVRTVVSRRR